MIWLQNILIVVVTLAVLGLGVTLSKKKPEIGGIISSFPTTVALVLIFTWLFESATSARLVAHSLSASIILFNAWMLLYFFLASKVKPLLTILFSLLALAVIAYGYRYLPNNFTLLYALYFLVWIVGSIFFFKKVKSVNLKSVIHTPPLGLFIFSAIYVAALVFSTKYVPPMVTAILSAFPTSALFVAYYTQTLSREHLTRYLGAGYIATPTISIFCLLIAGLPFSMANTLVVAFTIALLFSIFFAKLLSPNSYSRA